MLDKALPPGDLAYSKIYMDGYWPHVTYGVMYSIPETVNGKQDLIYLATYIAGATQMWLY